MRRPQPTRGEVTHLISIVPRSLSEALTRHATPPASHERSLRRLAIPHESEVLSPAHGAPDAVLTLVGVTG